MTKKVKLPITQAEEMRKYFALNNIKNKDIAEMLNVSPAAISNMLAGRDSIGKQRAFALHDAYGFDVTFLLTGVGSLIPGEGNAYAAPEPKTPGHEDAPGLPAGAVTHGWLVDFPAMMSRLDDIARRIAAIQDDIREFRRDKGGGGPENDRLWELVDRLTRVGDAAPGKDADGGKSAKD